MNAPFFTPWVPAKNLPSPSLSMIPYMAFLGPGVFLPRFFMTSLKDLAHGFHQSIVSLSHLPNPAVARSLVGMSVMVASGFFLRISPTLLLPSATIQHPHFISQI